MDYLRKPLTNMGFKLYLAARDLYWKKEGEDGNIIISPIAAGAMATLLYYASEGNEVNRQLESVLQYGELFEGQPDKKKILMAFREAIKILKKYEPEKSQVSQPFRLFMDSIIFVQKDADLNDEFIELIQKNLHIEIEKLDLNDVSPAREEVKKWLKAKIQFQFDQPLPKDFIDEQYMGPRAVITGVSHFSAHWHVPFDKRKSYRGNFFTEDGKTVPANYMTVTDTFAYVEDKVNGVKMIELPYLKNEATLILTMPIKRSTTLQEMLKTFPKNSADFTILHMQRRMQSVEVTLPRIFIECSYDIKTLFGALGIKDIFQDDVPLPALTKERKFRLQEGFLKCAIQFDEDGTFVRTDDLKGTEPDPKLKVVQESQPGLFSSMFGSAKPASNATKQFKADSSFVIGVRHNRAAIFVFTGCVMKP